MKILLSVLFVVLGIVSFIIIGGQILNTIFCALKMNFKLRKINLINFSHAMRQSLITIIIWIIILLIVIFLIFLISIYTVVSFCIGFILSFLISIKQIGMTESNRKDYFYAYNKHIKCNSYDYMQSHLIYNECPEFKEMTDEFYNMFKDESEEDE